MIGVKKIIAGGIITVIMCQMLVSCQQPSKISYNKPYDLTRLDFTMDVPYFMSGSIILKEFITDDENYRDDVSGIGRDTEMYHFCHWVDEKLSDTQHYIDENDNFIIDEATYQRWGILYEQSGHI